MLVVNDLNVRYGMHEALTGVNLQVSSDEIVVILGANGAGKSSLLGAIAGVCAGEIHGSIDFNGEAVIGLDAAHIVERGIAYVPEGRGVFADLSVAENLQLGSYTEHARRNEQQSLRAVLTLFPKLEERKKQIVRTMSGGEQQMVAIGRALMSAPSILMLDEPSLGLSPLLCKELFNSLEHVRDSGVGILLVEQNAKQSLGISDRGYLLGNGKIIGHDSAQQLLNDPNVQSAYLGGSAGTQTAKPKVTVVTDLLDKAKHGEIEPPTTAPVKVLINPTSDHRKTHTVSADSLVSEDINLMVARANSSATALRDADPSLPMQVVKLTDNQTPLAHERDYVRSNRSGMSSSTQPIANRQSLTETNDVEVLALLDEFEVAAQMAASRSTNSGISGDNVTASQSAYSAQADDNLPLPRIPVFKKSSVTVFRRDDNGTLRKKD